MSFTSCSQCCFSRCCPKLRKKEKIYAHVKYFPVSDQSLVESDGECPSDLVAIETQKVFSFPQQNCESTLHPMMFVESSVTRQPSSEYMQRFNSQSSATSTSVDYGLYVAGVAGVHEELLRRHTVATTGSTRSATLPRSGSKPLATTKKPNIRRASMPTIQYKEAWVPGLPIFEENILVGKNNEPTLQFSLHYDVLSSTLMVHLHHALNLPAKDRHGTSDPFVVLHLVPNKDEIFQSSVVYKTLNPIFDQSFQFQRLTPDDISHQTLVFRIYDHGRFTRNESIGIIALPLENADLYGVVMRMMIQEERTIPNKV